jgi:Response regulator containing a CheY-like receiver domain and an HTH DNA-binding domain
MAIKVSLYDDNTSLLESLSYLIKGTLGFELCHASTNASNVVADCERMRPDVILMDIDMPEISGIEATLLVKNAFPDVNVMMLTVFEDKNKIFDALCAGATGYMLKKSSSIELIEAIGELHKGGSPMSSGIARKVLEYFSKPANTEKKDKYQLTIREREILQRLLTGDSYKMIADNCFVSIGTVYSHINNVYKKLQVNSKSEAVIKALKERIV